MATGIPKTNTYYAKDRNAWRKWLQKNHTASSGVWLIYYKKDSGKTRVAYDHAVEEALCFGWIDSTLNPIDEYSYMQLFTPRKPKSNWSKLNKERVEMLIEQGLMTEAGLEKIAIAKENKSWSKIDHIESFTVPPDLEKALAKNKKAKVFFDTLSKTNKKYILYFISGVKSETLRATRVAEIIDAANAGKMHDRFIVVRKRKDKAG